MAVLLSRVERWISHVRLTCSHCRGVAHANYRTATGLAFCTSCWRRYALVRHMEREYHAECMVLCFPRFMSSCGHTVVETADLRYWLDYSQTASDEEIRNVYEEYELSEEMI